MRHHPPPLADAPPPVAPDLAEAALAFFPDLTELAPVAGREHLVRVEAPSGVWRVRRWPVETPAARIGFVHAVLIRAREAVPIVPVVAELPPATGGDGGSGLTRGDRRYDAQGWLPGRSVARPPAAATVGPGIDLPAVLPETTFAALAEVVARLHRATEGLARGRDVPAAPLAAMIRAVREAWAVQRERLRPIAPRTPPVQRWLATGERAIPAALAALERAASDERAAPVVLHLGLWPSHVLLDGGAAADSPAEIVGLIGWEAAAAGSPLLDLAHLVTRCRGWSAANAELALAAYAGLRPLPPEERRLLPAVAALDLVATAGRLLVHGYAPPSGADAGDRPSSALRAGADALIASLETATDVLAREERPAGAKARRRRPRSRSGGPPEDGGGPAGPPRRPAKRVPSPPRPGRAGPRRRDNGGGKR